MTGTLGHNITLVSTFILYQPGYTSVLYVDPMVVREWYKEAHIRHQGLGITVLGCNSTVSMQDEAFPACRTSFLTCPSTVIFVAGHLKLSFSQEAGYPLKCPDIFEALCLQPSEANRCEETRTVLFFRKRLPWPGGGAVHIAWRYRECHQKTTVAFGGLQGNCVN
ncbi:hypothetical protein PANDA_007336 [Ailuropoda melanoleuca]|uniref:Uncharacterized protein n=1 Tax=Ailuropoda melanoleuca TaxID=9646 RepID=D2HAA7_AILME|nr:hypothetical protein PANDA_007336 [Ailuropoda melanoleuca]